MLLIDGLMPAVAFGMLIGCDLCILFAIMQIGQQHDINGNETASAFHRKCLFMFVFVVSNKTKLNRDKAIIVQGNNKRQKHTMYSLMMKLNSFVHRSHQIRSFHNRR